MDNHINVSKRVLISVVSMDIKNIEITVKSGYEILDISYINGERSVIDYDYKKTRFATYDEMEKYRRYLEKRLDKRLFLMYKHYN